MFKDLLWYRQIVVASLAGGTAYLIGNQLGGRGGIVAAIICTLTIRISLHRSLREGFGQILGNLIGAIVATISVHYLGLGFFAIALTILICSVWQPFFVWEASPLSMCQLWR